MERLQQIPRLMHQLSAGETGLQHHSNRFLNERERQREVSVSERGTEDGK